MPHASDLKIPLSRILIFQTLVLIRPLTRQVYSWPSFQCIFSFQRNSSPPSRTFPYLQSPSHSAYGFQRKRTILSTTILGFSLGYSSPPFLSYPLHFSPFQNHSKEEMLLSWSQQGRTTTIVGVLRNNTRLKCGVSLSKWPLSSPIWVLEFLYDSYFPRNRPATRSYFDSCDPQSWVSSQRFLWWRSDLGIIHRCLDPRIIQLPGLDLTLSFHG